MATKKITKTTPESAKATKQAKKTSPKVAKDKTQKMSALDAAATILGETRLAMTCREIVEAMAAKGYWRSPSGATPHATLSAAIAREIKLKGKDSRFVKAERGKFARS